MIYFVLSDVNNSNTSNFLDPSNDNFMLFILIIIGILVLANITAVIICLRYTNNNNKKEKTEEELHRKKMSVKGEIMIRVSSNDIKEEMLRENVSKARSDLLPFTTTHSISKQKKTSKLKMNFSPPSIPLDISMQYRQGTGSTCFGLTSIPDLPISPKKIESHIKQALMDDEKAAQPYHKKSIDSQSIFGIELQDNVKLQQMIFPDATADTESYFFIIKIQFISFLTLNIKLLMAAEMNVWKDIKTRII